MSGSRGKGREGSSNDLYSDPRRNREQGCIGDMLQWVKVPGIGLDKLGWNLRGGTHGEKESSLS